MCVPVYFKNKMGVQSTQIFILIFPAYHHIVNFCLLHYIFIIWNMVFS